jgi:hypothetical protein
MRKVTWGSALRVLIILGALSCASALLATTWVWDAANYSGKLSGKAFQVMKLTRDPQGKVSGNKVMGIPPLKKGEKIAADNVNYQVNIPATGSYYLWARVRWTSGCGNRFYIAATGTRSALLGGDATYDALHWIVWNDAGKPKKLSLRKGVVTFTLSAKESGTMVNQFLLTNDPKYRPADVYTPTAGFVIH